MKKKLVFTIMGVVLFVGIFIFAKQKVIAPSNQNKLELVPKVINKKTTNMQQLSPKKYSITDPSSPWVIVNKVSSLPATYTPADLNSPIIGGMLRSQATNELNNLVSAANKASVSLKMISGYRSYTTQLNLYNGYVAEDGQAAADTYSARAGHSEHQSGWAADLGNGNCDLQICFATTSSGKWLAEHAHEFGFILRYQSGKESITGYQFEPWHVRYVGKDLAAELTKNNLTMEEYFKVVPDKQPY